MTMIYGITGGLASGKSYVSKIIRELGYIVYDADDIAHEVGNMPDILQRISEKFGEEMIVDGHLNRERLGEVVFNDKDKLSELNIIMAEAIKTKIITVIEECHQEKSSELYFMEVPLLFEQGYEKYFDGTIMVYTNAKVQLQRLVKRDGIDEVYAKKRINLQMSMNIKKTKADFIIDNSNELMPTEFQVRNILDELKINS